MKISDDTAARSAHHDGSRKSCPVAESASYVAAEKAAVRYSSQVGGNVHRSVRWIGIIKRNQNPPKCVHLQRLRGLDRCIVERMYDKRRHVRQAKNACSRASKERALKTTLSLRPHDDSVNRVFLREGDDRAGCAPFKEDGCAAYSCRRRS